MMDRAATLTAVLRAICAETCAHYGEPPCYAVAKEHRLEFPPATCDEPGCKALAERVVMALEGLEL